MNKANSKADAPMVWTALSGASFCVDAKPSVCVRVTDIFQFHLTIGGAVTIPNLVAKILRHRY